MAITNECRTCGYQWEQGFDGSHKCEPNSAAFYELGVEPVVEERMMKWFEFSHLPEHLQAVSKPFGKLAAKIVETVESGPERTVALRKLLEAKDAAVRAKLNPGC